MNKKQISFDTNITPEEYIRLMFECTDEEGVLYLPWIRDIGVASEVFRCRCRMNWSLAECEQTIEEFQKIYSNLNIIASCYDKISEDEEVNKEILGSESAFETWYTFIRPFGDYGFDMEEIEKINEKYDAIEEVKVISQKISVGEVITEYEKTFFQDNLDVTISAEEESVYDSYWEHRFKEAEQRVGTNICAHYYIIVAKRLCRLMSLQAPNIIIDSEAKRLASGMVVHKFAESKEDV